MENHSHITEKSGRFTGRHMAVIMVAFFGVVIAVNGIMAYVAVNSWTGLMARNGYVASQDFNALKAEQRRQDNLGFQSVLRYIGKTMEFTLQDSSKMPLKGFEITLNVGRPTHENDDRSFILKEQEPGIYREKLQLAPGQWNAEITAVDKAGRRYQRLVRLYVEKQEIQ